MPVMLNYSVFTQEICKIIAGQGKSSNARRVKLNQHAQKGMV